MVDPVRDVGTLAFGVLIGISVLGAGVASMPPARNARVFIGATIIAVAWLIIIGFVKNTESWLSTSSLVALDIGYAISFYLLSRPVSNDSSATNARKYNWAAWVTSVLVIIIYLELLHLIFVYTQLNTLLLLVLFSLLNLVFIFGLWRGFGAKPATYAAFLFAALYCAAAIAYVRTVNFLTLIVILIIANEARGSAMKNVLAWLHQNNQDNNRRSNSKKS
ncbi:MAG: hypothetical protein AAGD92_06925 [Pseudomonadota bacterium]